MSCSGFGSSRLSTANNQNFIQRAALDAYVNEDDQSTRALELDLTLDCVVLKPPISLFELLKGFLMESNVLYI